METFYGSTKKFIQALTLRGVMLMGGNITLSRSLPCKAGAGAGATVRLTVWKPLSLRAAQLWDQILMKPPKFLPPGLWFKVSLLVSPHWPPCLHTIVPSSLDNSGTLVSFPCSLLFNRLRGFKKGSTNSSILLPSRGRRGNSCSAPERGRT